MTSRSTPERFRIRGRKVLDQVAQAPDHIRKSFYELLTELEVGPYPHQHPSVSKARGAGITGKHRYVAWNDTVEVLYLVTQDQPVIVLIGVHWRGGSGGPGGGGGGGGGEPAEPAEWEWGLAA